MSVNANVSLPPLFVAVTVYVSCAATAVGVPVTAPLDELMASPAGSDGLTAQLTTSPPDADALLVLMADPLVYTAVAAVYPVTDGTTATRHNHAHNNTNGTREKE